MFSLGEEQCVDGVNGVNYFGPGAFAHKLAARRASCPENVTLSTRIQYNTTQAQIITHIKVPPGTSLRFALQHFAAHHPLRAASQRGQKAVAFYPARR